MQAPLLPSQVFGMPWVRPMLAETCPFPFDDPDYLFEVKWDGYRCIAYVTQGRTALYSRNGRSLLEVFGHLSSIHKNLLVRKAKRAIFDGEIVSFQGKRLSFQALSKNPQKASYVVFDLLFLDDKSLLEIPLQDRKYLLSEMVDEDEKISISYAVQGEGKELFSWVRARDLEGIMAKKRKSLYHQGIRSKDWLKVRNIKEGKFWVLGYVPSPGKRIGSLILAQNVPKDSHLQPFAIRGRVGLSLSPEEEQELVSFLGKTSDKPPFHLEGTLSKAEREKALWVEPKLQVLVHYTEITEEGRLRHPVFREFVRGKDST